MTEIKKDAGDREDYDHDIDQPVQHDVECVVTQLAGIRNEKGADLLERDAGREAAARHVEDVRRGAEEKGEAGKEMPSPNLALRKDRFQPLRDDRVRVVGSNTNPGEHADKERKRREPMNDQRADVGSRSIPSARGTADSSLLPPRIHAVPKRLRLVIARVNNVGHAVTPPDLAGAYSYHEVKAKGEIVVKKD